MGFFFDPEWEIDPYSLEIQEKLGEGEFGLVHKARWFGAPVAIKILKVSDDVALSEFRDEIETLRRVHHPNAVQFLGACTQQAPFVLVTELMSGGSLADAFRSSYFFPTRRAVEIALDAARCLAYLHHRTPNPVIHRDLKPANLMFGGGQYEDQLQILYDTGVVKVADFGLCKSLPFIKHDSASSQNALLDCKFKLTGETGSYRYMAPEVFLHEPYNSRVDVYSFSMILYQLFEFQAPFAGLDAMEAARQAAMYEKRPEFVSLLQPTPIKQALRKLIVQCWSANPQDRPPFAIIVPQLERILSQLPRASMSGRGNGCCGCFG